MGITFLALGITGIVKGLNWKNNIENQLEHPGKGLLLGGEIFLAVGLVLLALALVHSYGVYKHFKDFEVDGNSQSENENSRPT